jgi:hypothetical protein
MNWIERWRAISSRILALGEAYNFLVQTYQAHNAEHGGLRFVFAEIKDIGEELKRFFSMHRGASLSSWNRFTKCSGFSSHLRVEWPGRSGRVADGWAFGFCGAVRDG